MNEASVAKGRTFDLPTKSQKLSKLVQTGVLCGSTYLNQRLHVALRRRLEKERYLRGLEDILDKVTMRFDLDIKKGFDGTEGEFFTVPGLREDLDRGFEDGRLLLSW